MTINYKNIEGITQQLEFNSTEVSPEVINQYLLDTLGYIPQYVSAETE